MQYKIIGDSLPAVICDVNEGETLITEKGAMELSIVFNTLIRRR